MRRKDSLILGVFCFVFGSFCSIMFWKGDYIFPAVLTFVSFFGFGAYSIFYDPNKILELRTAHIHEMTSEGYVHTKDKTMNISATYMNSRRLGDQCSISSDNEYVIRVQTPLGFYDVYGRNAYMSYKEDDKVLLKIRTRYNKKDEPFHKEVTILGLLPPDRD